MLDANPGEQRQREPGDQHIEDRSALAPLSRLLWRDAHAPEAIGIGAPLGVEIAHLRAYAVGGPA